MTSERCAACGSTVDYEDAYTHVERGDAVVAVCSKKCLGRLTEEQVRGASEDQATDGLPG